MARSSLLMVAALSFVSIVAYAQSPPTPLPQDVQQEDPNPVFPPKPAGGRALDDWNRLISGTPNHLLPIGVPSGRRHSPPRTDINGQPINLQKLKVWSITDIEQAIWAGQIVVPVLYANTFGSAGGYIEGSFVIPNSSAPSFDCSGSPDGNCWDSVWVGLGGITSTNLIQAGINNIISGGTQYCQVWWEQLPAEETVLTNFPCWPGDTIQIEVWGAGWYIGDFDTSTSMSGNFPSGETQGDTAEWIAERTTVCNSNGSNCGPSILADFHHIPFQGYAYGKPPNSSFYNFYYPCESDAFSDIMVQNNQDVAYPTCSADTNFDLYTEGSGY